MSCVTDTDTVTLTVSGGVLEADVNINPDPTNALSESAAGLYVSSQNETGWFPAGETWTYASADAPTFTFTVQGDKTGKYDPGMRVKLDQTTTRYFIITAVSYNSGTGLTTVTVYGGTDYTLANAAITNPFYSVGKAPLDFNPDPLKWAVILTDTADYLQNSPFAGTWYNLGSKSLTVPIGVWELDYEVQVQAHMGSAASVDIWACLSLANNSATDQQLVSVTQGYSAVEALAKRRKTIEVAAKSVYYLNVRTQNSPNDINIQGADGTTVLRAVCSYL